MNEKPKSSVIIHEENEEEEDSNEPMNDAILEDENILNIPVHTHPRQEPIQEQRVPPFPKRLVIEKCVVHPEYEILNELKNICVKISLLQGIKDIPIYSKVIKELCIKCPGKKQKDPLTIHVIGEMSECMIDQSRIAKYTNPAPVVTIIVNNTTIENTLIDLGSAINMMTIAVLEVLKLGQFLQPTPSILELAYCTMVKPAGVLDDIIVSVASWEYPIEFNVVE